MGALHAVTNISQYNARANDSIRAEIQKPAQFDLIPANSNRRIHPVPGYKSRELKSPRDVNQKTKKLVHWFHYGSVTRHFG
jgi:hypothetical protein